MTESISYVVVSGLGEVQRCVTAAEANRHLNTYLEDQAHGELQDGDLRYCVLTGPNGAVRIDTYRPDLPAMSEHDSTDQPLVFVMWHPFRGVGERPFAAFTSSREAARVAEQIAMMGMPSPEMSERDRQPYATTTWHEDAQERAEGE